MSLESHPNGIHRHNVTWQFIVWTCLGARTSAYLARSACKHVKKSEVQLYFSFYLGDRRGGWLTPRPGRFTRGKETRYPLYRRLGRPQGRSGQVRKISPPSGFNPRTVQPVASRYTDWAIPAHPVNMRTTEITLKLIEDLHSMPCLWDPSSSAYKDGNKNKWCHGFIGCEIQRYCQGDGQETPYFGVPISTETQKANKLPEEWNVTQKCAWFGHKPLKFLLAVTASKGSRNMATERRVDVGEINLF